jgi:hypothetical protein
MSSEHQRPDTAIGFATAVDEAPPTFVSGLSWREIMLRVGLTYLITRACVLAGAGIVAAQEVAEANRLGLERPRNAVGLILQVLTSWDGRWYYEIIRGWYPTEIPPDVTYEMPEARAAFFPMYPMIVRTVDPLLPGGDVFAGVAVNVVFGILGVWLIGLLARELYDEQIAYRAMVLFLAFPGSFALSFTYSEAVLIAVAAGCLLCLVRHQWLAAGLLAAIGTACRPNGLALVAACAVAAVIAIRTRREWRSLVAVALSPLGFVGFQLYLLDRTGEWAWFRVQTEAWDEGTSFGWTAIRNTIEAFLRPLSSPTDVITAASVVVTVALLAIVWKVRPSAPLVAYVLVVFALMILPATVTARPRFVITAFPVFIAVAAWWPAERDRERDLWTATIACGTAGLVALTGLYGVLGAIP